MSLKFEWDLEKAITNEKKLPRKRENYMKKAKKSKKWKMLDEYDFRGGVRGKYAKKYAHGTNLVLLEPDVAKIFPNSRSVNKALRSLSHFIHE